MTEQESNHKTIDGKQKGKSETSKHLHQHSLLPFTAFKVEPKSLFFTSSSCHQNQFANWDNWSLNWYLFLSVPAIAEIVLMFIKSCTCDVNLSWYYVLPWQYSLWVWVESPIWGCLGIRFIYPQWYLFQTVSNTGFWTEISHIPAAFQFSKFYKFLFQFSIWNFIASTNSFCV